MSENLEKVVYQFSAPAKCAVNSISFSADNKLLAVAQESAKEESPTLSLVRTDTGECIHIIERTKEYSNGVYQVVFDALRNRLIYITQINGGFSLNIYNLDSGDRKSLDTFESHIVQHSLSLDKHNKYLLVRGLPIKLWNLENDKVIKNILIPKEKVAEEDEANISISSAISPDGKHLIVGGIKEGILSLYDTQTEKLVRNYNCPFQRFQQVTFNHTSRQLAAVNWYGNGIFLWNANKGVRILESLFNEDLDLISSIRFSPKKNCLAIGFVSSYVVLYNLDNGSKITADKLHNSRVYDVCFSLDGKLLASAGEDSKIFVRSL